MQSGNCGCRCCLLSKRQGWNSRELSFVYMCSVFADKRMIFIAFYRGALGRMYCSLPLSTSSAIGLRGMLTRDFTAQPLFYYPLTLLCFSLLQTPPRLTVGTIRLIIKDFFTILQGKHTVSPERRQKG